MLITSLHIHSLLRESIRYLACNVKPGQAQVSLCHVTRGAMTCPHMPRGTPTLSTSTRAAMRELTHPVIVVTDFDDGFILPEIPHSSSAARAGRCQDMLDLPVPCNAADVLKRLLHTQNSLSQPFQIEDSKPVIFRTCYMTNLQGGSSQVLHVFWFPMYTGCRVKCLKTPIYKLLVFLQYLHFLLYNMI